VREGESKREEVKEGGWEEEKVVGSRRGEACGNFKGKARSCDYYTQKLQ
jgi:hypothetical protein